MTIENLIKTAKLNNDLTWYEKNFLPLLISGKEYYKKIQDETGIPMGFVACLHARESASDVGKFKKYLGNGQSLTQKTTIVPKNRGPFSSWHEGAIDALKLKKLHQIKNWTLETCISEWEKYNGLGYKNRGKLSPYVWSGTNHGAGTGLFVSDGKYDPKGQDKNLGCFAFYSLLIEQDKDFVIEKEVQMEKQKGFWASVWDFLKSLFSGSTKQEVVYKYISKIPTYGQKNKNVGVIQTSLNEFGYKLVVDDDFGPKTKVAISNFQKLNGLAGSGIIGTKTIQFLGIKIGTPEVNDSSNDQEKVFAIASNEIGVKEVSGTKANPRIVEYHDTTGKWSSDEVSWCGSFVEWCLKQAGIKGIGAEGAGARNWLDFGFETKTPKKGDIVVFWRESLSSWKGHVAFYSHETSTHIYVLGGNQSNAVNVSAYPKSQLLEYRSY